MLALMAIVLMVLATGPAAAQQPRGQGRSLLDIIFGIHRQSAYPPAPPPPTRHYRRAPAQRRSAPPPAASAPAAVTKLDNARKILVLGDFMASGLASGLEAAFAQSPGVVVVDKTNGSSGLVRNDYYDWPAEIGPILDQVKPAITVVMIGSNDRQAMKVNGNAEPVRSDAWTAEYTRRATTVATAVTSRHIPLIWAGVPAFQSPSMSADILAFDAIFRSVATKAGGEYVDTWDGFVDDKGNFIFTGADINGQQVRLRGSDGITLTTAGKQKLAFYVEKPVRRLLGGSAGKDITTLTNQNLPDLTPLGPQPPAMIVRTEPVSLEDPTLDGDTALLGAKPLPAGPADAPRTLLVRDGKVGTPPAGRADNFAWKTAGEKPVTGKKTPDRKSEPPTGTAATSAMKAGATPAQPAGTLQPAQ